MAVSPALLDVRDDFTPRRNLDVVVHYRGGVTTLTSGVQEAWTTILLSL